LTRVSVARSTLTSALLGTAIVALVLLVVLLSSASVSSTSSVTLHTGRQPIEWHIPAGELIVSPLILLISFPVFVLIGRRAARPIEQARRQQLRFAVDASHELRTPLTVVEGEASLALRGRRRAAEYRLALEKILAESRRMRQQVDDLMWLARAETNPVRPEFVEVDLARVADLAVERFDSVAAARGLRVSASTAGAGQRPVVVAPVEWMERLAAVLLDNACRYTPEGGEIRVTTGAAEDRISLTVEDSGPGIPEAEWDRIFDRFHRVTQTVGGSGLGLAIGARVVAETGGTWRVDRSELGGALLEVRWRHRDARARRRRLTL
jgi:two-component system, OmpR family, sensor histidine kinase CiaH